MPGESERKLFQFLGYEEPASLEASAALEASPRAFSIDSITELRQELHGDPERVMGLAQDLLEGSPSREEFELTLRTAEIAFRKPEATLAILEAGLGVDMPFDLPEKHRFPGYDKDAIPIFPSKTTFETRADAPAWAIQAAIAVWEALQIPRPSFPRHSAARPYDYPLEERDGKTTLTLFSDWGTGYYHSRYIARHIESLQPAQAIHLGDVYYAGRQREFDEYFTSILEPLVATTPFYALNANHEMMSRGGPYFAYLASKRAEGGQSGRARQPQEGSYFCLANEGYQVIGIDTAFFGNGRYQDAGLRDWLSQRLARGREQRKVNILLSQNEPYGPVRNELPGPRPLLNEDLKSVVKQVDVWFWGDEHYCALYAPGPSTPFVGSCIGHAGYPYTRKEGKNDVASGVGAEVVWVETEGRFPAELELRPTRGNNGFCYLTLHPDRIQLQYMDWRRRIRHEVTLTVSQGRVALAG